MLKTFTLETQLKLTKTPTPNICKYNVNAKYTNLTQKFRYISSVNVTYTKILDIFSSSTPAKNETSIGTSTPAKPKPHPKIKIHFLQMQVRKLSPKKYFQKY